MLLESIRHIGRRRGDLRSAIEYENLDRWEESCVPSYCHPNILAAGVSWLRLFAALKLAERLRPDPVRVLDFGSSVGEVGHLLPARSIRYDFIERDDVAAEFLLSRLRGANRQTLESAAGESYDWVFAIDSLEHNNNYAELLQTLSAKLAPGGIFILSGPTENALYRLGRRVAGFNSHYHVTTVYHIEAAAGWGLQRVGLRTVPFGVPLFRISGWTKAQLPRS